jgi:hypothetical protein
LLKVTKAIKQKLIQQLKVTAKVAEELNQSNENSDTPKKQKHGKIRRVLKKNGKAK